MNNLYNVTIRVPYKTTDMMSYPSVGWAEEMDFSRSMILHLLVETTTFRNAIKQAEKIGRQWRDSHDNDEPEGPIEIRSCKIDNRFDFVEMLNG